MTQKTRLMAAIMVLCPLLSGFTFFPQPRPGRLCVSDIGSDGGAVRVNRQKGRVPRCLRQLVRAAKPTSGG